MTKFSPSPRFMSRKFRIENAGKLNSFKLTVRVFSSSSWMSRFEIKSGRVIFLKLISHKITNLSNVFHWDVRAKKLFPNFLFGPSAPVVLKGIETFEFKNLLAAAYFYNLWYHVFYECSFRSMMLA